MAIALSSKSQGKDKPGTMVTARSADSGGEVSNLSFGGSYSQAFNNAVHNAVEACLCMVVAAGTAMRMRAIFRRPPSRLPTLSGKSMPPIPNLASSIRESV